MKRIVVLHVEIRHQRKLARGAEEWHAQRERELEGRIQSLKQENRELRKGELRCICEKGGCRIDELYPRKLQEEVKQRDKLQRRRT
jgi:hypothetical protein